MNVVNSTITGNDGGGIRSHISGTAGITIGDGGKTFIFEGTVTVANSIVAGNGASDLSGDFGNTASSLIGGDPRFVRNPSHGGDGWGDNLATAEVDESANDDYGDLHLLPASPAINAGSNSLAVGAQGDPLTTDLDGNPRIRFGRVDAGVYEFWQALTPAETVPGDATLDGFVDQADALVLAAHWGNRGVQWEDGDFNRSGSVEAADAAILAANWGQFYTPPREQPLAAPSTFAETAGPTSVGPIQLSPTDAMRRRIGPSRLPATSLATNAAAMSRTESSKVGSTVAQQQAHDAVWAEPYGLQVESTPLRRERLAWSHVMARRSVATHEARRPAPRVAAVDALLAVDEP